MFKFASFDTKAVADWSLFKFKFSLMNDQSQTMIDFIFNSDFGLRILNHANRESDKYLDIDMDFKKTAKQMFLVLHKGKVYVAVNGLSFADVIYFDEFSDPNAGIAQYRIEVDLDYTTPKFLQETSVAVLAESISDNLDR
jgi:hypothetical protein